MNDEDRKMLKEMKEQTDKIPKMAETVRKTYALLVNEDGEEFSTREIVATQGDHKERIESVEKFLKPQGYERPEGV